MLFNSVYQLIILMPAIMLSYVGLLVTAKNKMKIIALNLKVGEV